MVSTPRCFAPIALIALAFACPTGAGAQAMPGMDMPGPKVPDAQSSAMPAMDHGDMAKMDHGQSMEMPGAFGPYVMAREASGTSWQPDVSPHLGIHRMAARWTLMVHGMLNGVYDYQSGPRGADRAFVGGMIMGMATDQLTDRDTVQFRAMLSPDPLMGPRGYPLLLAAGETADGKTQLVDRQHPHDLFMELSGSYSRRIGTNGSVFIYAGLPGEPAFGPPAFMHRLSIMDSPEAPISHHWLDSTHITFGVVTAGATLGGVKLEASQFKGREPDQHRYGIEAPRLDSTSVRVSWNPAPTLSLQASYGYLKSPEQLSPAEDSERWSASAIYTHHLGSDGYVAATGAWGRKRGVTAGTRDEPLDAYVLEATVKPDARWTVFARGERIESDELLPGAGGLHGPVFAVGKASVGAIRDFPLIPNVIFGVGGLVAQSFVPAGLATSYGGDRTSGMAFVRLKLG